MCVNCIWISPYTLTLECAMVSAKDLEGIQNSSIVRGDDSRGHREPQKMAKGCVRILKTGIDAAHPHELGRPAGLAMTG